LEDGRNVLPRGRQVAAVARQQWVGRQIHVPVDPAAPDFLLDRDEVVRLESVAPSRQRLLPAPAPLGVSGAPHTGALLPESRPGREGLALRSAAVPAGSARWFLFPLAASRAGRP